MNRSASEDKIKQMLHEFGEIQNIHASPGWNESLMNRLDSVKPATSSGSSSTGYGLLILLVILINLGFIFNTVINKPRQNLYKEFEMKSISEEFLINPVSIKN
jgi:hypothetical protein